MASPLSNRRARLVGTRSFGKGETDSRSETSLPRAGPGNLHRAISGVSACQRARYGPRIRSDHVETTAPEPHGGFQGEGGACRRHVKTLMRRMGIEALYRRPRTTKPEPGHKIYPYLLRGMTIARPNQVWAMDITPAFAGAGSTSRWNAASSIWPWCSIGSAVACCRGGCRSRWRRRSASKHWRMLWPVTASRTSSTPTRARSSPARPSPACYPERHCHQHGRQRGLAGQCLRRTAVAQRQIRGGVSAGLRQRRPGPRFDRPLLGLLQWTAPAFEP